MLVFSTGGKPEFDFPWDEILQVMAKPGGAWHPSHAKESYMAIESAGEAKRSSTGQGNGSKAGVCSIYMYICTYVYMYMRICIEE